VATPKSGPFKNQQRKDKEKMSLSIQALRDAEDKKLAVARAQHEKATLLLGQLPAQTPEPSVLNTFGYCADYGLWFNRPELVQQLLELYPPIPLVDLSGGSRTQKPLAYVRDNERSDSLLPLHPVVYKGGVGEAREAVWWTSLPCGMVQVHVKGVKAYEGIPDSEAYRYEKLVHSYSTGAAEFFTKKLAAVQGKPSPMLAWSRAWGEYISLQDLNAKQRRFVSAVMAHVERTGAGPAWPELPEPQYIKAGTATAFGPGEDLIEGLAKLQAKQAARAEHSFDRIGDFWSCFDTAQAETLLAFAQKQAVRLPQAVANEANAEEAVRKVIVKLMADVAFFTNEPNSQMSQRLEQYLIRETGFEVHVMDVIVKYGKGNAWLRFHSNSKGLTFSFEGDPNGKRLQPQDMEVEYV
jgi:hypothetical protein